MIGWAWKGGWCWSDGCRVAIHEGCFGLGKMGGRMTCERWVLVIVP